MRDAPAALIALARMVRSERNAQRLTQVDLQGLANVGERFVVELEQGKPTLAIAKVIAVLEALGLRLHAQRRTTSEAATHVGREHVGANATATGRAGSTASPAGQILVVARYTALPDEGLVSRSLARTVLQDASRAGSIVLDFAGVKWIGQSFADEIFRVFANAQPQLAINAINASPAVQQMIRRARGARVEPSA